MCSRQEWLSAHQLLTESNGDVNVNVCDESGTTPLMHAVYYGQYSLVERLLEFGAAPNMAFGHWQNPNNNVGSQRTSG